MSANNGESKLQQLLDKMGGMAGMAVLALVLFVYQTDRAAQQAVNLQHKKDITAVLRAVDKVRDDKVSKAEFKDALQSMTTETRGLRQDLKDLMRGWMIDIKTMQQK